MKKILLSIALFYSFTSVVSAADLALVAPESIKSGTQFTVAVALDTEGIAINSFDVTLSYPKDLISFQGYKESGSLKKLWITPPRDTDGSIHISGIIPGGVEGLYDPDKNGLQPLPLAQLLFSPKTNGTAFLQITDSTILENNGSGTALLHTKKNVSIAIALPADADTEHISLSKDITPPLPFTILYIPAGFFSRTPSMISFFTTDEESGVAKYQTQTINRKWKDVTSPSPAPKGLVKRTIVVQALDWNGNAREAHIDIPGLFSSMQLFIFLILSIICYLIYFMIKRKYEKS